MTFPQPSFSPQPPTFVSRSRRGAARILGSVILALAAALTASLATLSSAQATTSRLCYGFEDCRAAGYRLFGYPSAMSTMWWQMYAGHNCTNYVAYRLVRGGMPNQRPWSGEGNAGNWGYAMDHITDQTPTVGSVAWWKAYAPGAGSSGHVGIVQKVISPDEILVSQDSWGGDFSWTRVTRGGEGWPSGFIHFNDAELTTGTTPTISGAPRVGETLSTDGGTWKPRAVTRSYVWRVGGKAVAGATGSTYTVRPQDQGKQVRVVVTATKEGYPAKRIRSKRTDVVSARALANTSAPTIRGIAQVGRTLSATRGTWIKKPDEVSFQWLADGTPIPGATGRTFVLIGAQAGRRLQVQVTAARGSSAPGTALSLATEPVTAGVLANTTRPSITGRPAVGETLTAFRGWWSAEPDSVRYQWRSAGKPIKGATSATFTPGKEQRGQWVRVKVTAIKAGYTAASIKSPKTPPIAKGTIDAVSAPKVVGLAQPGHTLTFDPGTVSPQVPPRLQWMRNGEPIAGATSTTYRLTTKDLGAQLSVGATYEAPGLASLTTQAASSRPVRSASSVRVRASRPAPGTVRLTGTVEATDVETVVGTALVKWRGQVIDIVDLVDGSYRIDVTDLPAGERRLTVVHRATAVTARSKERVLVEVR